MGSFIRAVLEAARQPPPGETPNFAHAPSLERYVLPTEIVFFIMVPICVLLRVYTSYFIIHRVGAEECQYHRDDAVVLLTDHFQIHAWYLL